MGSQKKIPIVLLVCIPLLFSGLLLFATERIFWNSVSGREPGDSASFDGGDRYLFIERIRDENRPKTYLLHYRLGEKEFFFLGENHYLTDEIDLIGSSGVLPAVQAYVRESFDAAPDPDIRLDAMMEQGGAAFIAGEIGGETVRLQLRDQLGYDERSLAYTFVGMDRRFRAREERPGFAELVADLKEDGYIPAGTELSGQGYRLWHLAARKPNRFWKTAFYFNLYRELYALERIHEAVGRHEVVLARFGRKHLENMKPLLDERYGSPVAVYAVADGTVRQLADDPFAPLFELTPPPNEEGRRQLEENGGKIRIRSDAEISAIRATTQTNGFAEIEAWWFGWADGPSGITLRDWFQILFNPFALKAYDDGTYELELSRIPGGDIAVKIFALDGNGNPLESGIFFYPQIPE